MATSFHTLKFVERLETGGFTLPLTTRSDLQTELHPIRIDLAVLKWMLGAVLAGVLSLVVKTLFA